MDELIKVLRNNRMSYSLKMEAIMNTPGLEYKDFKWITQTLGYKPGFAKYLERDYIKNANCGSSESSEELTVYDLK